MGSAISKEGAFSKRPKVTVIPSVPDSADIASESAIISSRNSGIPDQISMYVSSEKIEMTRMEDWTEPVSGDAETAETNENNAKMKNCNLAVLDLMKELDDLIADSKAQHGEWGRVLEDIKELRVKDERLFSEAKSWLVRAKLEGFPSLEEVSVKRGA